MRRTRRPGREDPLQGHLDRRPASGLCGGPRPRRSQGRGDGQDHIRRHRHRLGRAGRTDPRQGQRLPRRQAGQGRRHPRDPLPPTKVLYKTTFAKLGHHDLTISVNGTRDHPTVAIDEFVVRGGLVPAIDGEALARGGPKGRPGKQSPAPSPASTPAAAATPVPARYAGPDSCADPDGRVRDAGPDPDGRSATPAPTPAPTPTAASATPAPTPAPTPTAASATPACRPRRPRRRRGRPPSPISSPPTRPRRA